MSNSWLASPFTDCDLDNDTMFYLFLKELIALGKVTGH